MVSRYLYCCVLRVCVNCITVFILLCFESMCQWHHGIYIAVFSKYVSMVSRYLYCCVFKVCVNGITVFILLFCESICQGYHGIYIAVL